MGYHEVEIVSDGSGDGEQETSPLSGYISAIKIVPHASAGGSMTVTIHEVGGNNRQLWTATVGTTTQEFTPTQDEVDSTNSPTGETSPIRVGSKLKAVVDVAGSALAPAATVQFWIDEIRLC